MFLISGFINQGAPPVCMIAVGKHDNRLVIIPYDKSVDSIMPVTIHATTRQQIKFRLKTGRFIHE